VTRGPEITVIIPAHNAGDTLADTLAGLRGQRGAGASEVIVVDDGSADETASIAERSPIVDRVIRLNGVGPGRARNAGAAAARAHRLAFLDADCRPTERWLATGSGELESADFVLGETRPRPDQQLGPFDRTLWVVGGSPLFESANLFVRRPLFDQLGGFESWLGPRGGKELGEDVWFGWRAVRAGARIVACPEALVHHQVYPRGPVEFAAERWRLRFFPAMVRRMPELRRAAFHRRYFLTARAARFDAAVAGLVLAGISRRPVLTLAAIPYVRLLARELNELPAVGSVAAGCAADAVGLAALAAGSVRNRTLLL
jgi:glycosyltransferase involved in cell wall biosynthesis